MQWGNKNIPLGASRILNKFAYLPVRTDDCWIWWEAYYIRQVFRQIHPSISSYASQNILTDQKQWVTIERKPVNSKGKDDIPRK